MPAKPIPEGYHTLTVYLVVKNSLKAIDFYAEAFDARETMRLTMPDGSIAHAEMKLGDSRFMLSDENPQWGNKGPRSLGGTPVGLSIYVEDCDAVFARAVAAGAKAERPVENQFYGDRSGTVIDPDGHKWTIATRKFDMSTIEMQAAMDEWLKSMGPK